MIQYCHNRIPEFRLYEDIPSCVISPRGGDTIALEVIEPWFFDGLTVGDFFEKRVGTARCSKDDNYCKKTGRDLATQRMKTKRLTVKQIGGTDEVKVMVLVDKDNNLYALRKVKGNKVHFIEFHHGQK